MDIKFFLILTDRFTQFLSKESNEVPFIFKVLDKLYLN